MINKITQTNDVLEIQKLIEKQLLVSVGETETTLRRLYQLLKP
eukprot:UN17418